MSNSTLAQDDMRLHERVITNCKKTCELCQAETSGDVLQVPDQDEDTPKSSSEEDNDTSNVDNDDTWIFLF